MLVNLKSYEFSDKAKGILIEVYGKYENFSLRAFKPQRITDGVYVTHTLNPEVYLPFELTFKDRYGRGPAPGEDQAEFWEKKYVPQYGVCDEWQDVIRRYPKLVSLEDKFILLLTPVTKESQPDSGGWRWHKWGDYCGKHSITTEYLKDEPEISQVYVWHAYRISELNEKYIEVPEKQPEINHE